MNSTGRRRWRKWLASQRKLGRTGARGVAFYHRHNPHDGFGVPGQSIGAACRSPQPVDPNPLPPRPFSAKSLCGMTAGARKRLALWDVYVPFCAENTDETPPISWRRRSMSAISHDPGLHAACNEARAKYRIGERLRPCVGCWQCQPDRACQGCGSRYTEGCEVCSAYADDRYVYVCDGSGLKGARKNGGR